MVNVSVRSRKIIITKIILIITSAPSLGTTPGMSVVSSTLVETSEYLLIVVIYEQHIAVLLVMMIVDSISTSDTVVYTVLYVGGLYTAMVNSSLIITSLNIAFYSIPSGTLITVVSITPSNSPIVAITDTV